MIAPYFPIHVEMRLWAAPELALRRLAFPAAWLTIGNRGVLLKIPRTQMRNLLSGITSAWGRQTVGERDPSTPEFFGLHFSVAPFCFTTADTIQLR
jgi:hypothetical protein